MKFSILLFAALLALFSNVYAAEPEFDGNCSMYMTVVQGRTQS